MRMVMYIVILGLLFLAPLKRLDVAKLEPVQTIAVRTVDGAIELETDTGNKGRGSTIETAVADLEKKTPGVIYLDTAQYLLLTQQTVVHVNALRSYLRPGIRVSLWDGAGSVQSAAQYLDVCSDLPKLKDWKDNEKKIAEN